MTGIVAYATLVGLRRFSHCYSVSEFAVSAYIFRARPIPFRHGVNRITPDVMPHAVSHYAVNRARLDRLSRLDALSDFLNLCGRVLACVISTPLEQEAELWRELVVRAGHKRYKIRR